MNKRILISLLVLLLICCLCTSAISLATGGFLLFESQTRVGSLPTAAPTSRPTHTPVPTLEAQVQPQPTEKIASPEPTLSWQAAEIPEEISAQMDEIQNQVERLRGLYQRDPVTRTILTQDQLRERFMKDFFEENDEQTIEDDLRVLSAFGLIDPEFDLFNFYLELYTEQVAGFYDDESKEMVVIQGEEFDAPERLTYAHEFTHILQDQQFGFRDQLGINEDNCQVDSEYCAAVQALIEGDASLTELNWLYTHGTDEDRLQIEEFYAEMESPVFDLAPDFIKEDFGFPYTAGVEFVFDLFEQGGYSAIDAAYSNPPVSTEQILHPEKYPNDVPVEVFMPDLGAVLGKDLRELDRGVIGELYTYLMLAKGRTDSMRLSETRARRAAEGWGGDAYAVYYDEASDSTLIAAQFVWDSQDDARDFFGAFKDYGNLRWGQSDSSALENTLSWENTIDGAVIMQWDGVTTSWVIAPDSDSAWILLQSLGEGEYARLN